MMQARLQAEYDPAAMMGAQQQSPFGLTPTMSPPQQHAARYEAAMAADFSQQLQQQQQQPAGAGDFGSMQRQMLAWQMQQLRPLKQQPLQLTYNNPVAQQDGQDDQVPYRSSLQLALLKQTDYCERMCISC